MNRIETSNEDMAVLSQYGLKPAQVVEEICTVVAKAEEIYLQTKKSKILVDDHIEVCVPVNRRRRLVDCSFCDHKTCAPGEYVIENINTKVKIVFDHHNLHELKEHHYFGIDCDRVDPLQASALFGLQTQGK